MPVTANITSDHRPPTHYVVCPVCGGWVTFNLPEIEERKSRGQNQSLRCWGAGGPPSRDAPGEHWHPSSPWAAGEIKEFHWDQAEP